MGKQKRFDIIFTYIFHGTEHRLAAGPLKSPHHRHYEYNASKGNLIDAGVA